MVRPIPVLMYHHVAPYPGDMVTVTPGTFEGQMRHLAESGYAALSLDELLSAIRREWTPPKKAAVITFDDGWLDNWVHAFPVLRKYRLRASVFVVTGWVQRASAGSSVAGPYTFPPHREARRMAERGETRGVVLDWEHIEEMQASGFVDFYSHTVHHARCDRIAPEASAEELRESKRTLEERLGRPCPYLCWPFGKYSTEAVALAQEAGYRAIFTTRHDVAGPGTDPFDIPRIVVKDAVPWFARRLRVYTSPLLSRAYLAVKKS
jgi:peptidoglycan/xylan/chitin deacetylase (PgdA/CDA1 family)